MRAGRAGTGSPSASTVLEVADGLRARDPHLACALVEHAVRLGGGDPVVGRAARLASARSLAELDRPAELLTRFAAEPDDADTEARTQDAVAWRALVAGAALEVGSPAAARTLLADACDTDAPPWCVPVLAVLRARERATAGDVVGCDAAAGAVGPDVPPTVALDLLRARAAARTAAADPDGALLLLGTDGVVGSDPDADPDADADADGGRRAAQVAADHVAALLGRGDRRAALDRAAPFLSRAPGPSSAVAVAHLATDVARRVHLPAGETDRALDLLVRAEADLAARRLPGPAGRAGLALAEAAEAAGDLRRALAALRRAHAHEVQARDAEHAARAALSSVLVRTLPDEGRPAGAGHDPDAMTTSGTDRSPLDPAPSTVTISVSGVDDGGHPHGRDGDGAAPPATTTAAYGRGRARHGRRDGDGGATTVDGNHRAPRTPTGSDADATSAGTPTGRGRHGTDVGPVDVEPDRQEPGDASGVARTATGPGTAGPGPGAADAQRPAPRTHHGRPPPAVESGGTEVDVPTSRGTSEDRAPGDPGLRLADLLAEAMAAFREVGPATEDPDTRPVRSPSGHGSVSGR